MLRQVPSFANIIDIVRSGKRSPMLGFNHPLEEGLHLKSQGDIRSKYYLRLRVLDKPGILAQITQLFANHAISIGLDLFSALRRRSVRICFLQLMKQQKERFIN